MTLLSFSRLGDSAARIRRYTLLGFVLTVGLQAGTSPGRPAVPAAGAKDALATTRLGFHFEAQPKTTAAEGGSASRGAAPGPSTQGPVFVMPKMVVTTRREKLNPREMLTSRGKTELAEKTYLSPLYRAVGGPLIQVATYYFDFTSILGGWHPNEVEARTLYEEDQRMRRLTEMDDLMKLDTLGRKTNGAMIEGLHVQARREGIEALYGQP